MSTPAHSAPSPAESGHSESPHGAAPHGGAHSQAHYVKIWAILVVLLVISVAGPELEIRVVTLITAFGIACVKAFLVAKHFMHLDVERRPVVYILVTCLALMLLFFFAVAPDVMRHMGANWENTGAANMIKMVEEPSHAGDHAEPAAHGGAAPAHGADPGHEAAPTHAEPAPAHESAPEAGAH